MVFPTKARRKPGTKRSQGAFKRFVRAPRRDDRLMKCFVISVPATSEASRYRGGGRIGTGWINRLLRGKESWPRIRFRNRSATGIGDHRRRTGTLADREAQHKTLRHEPFSICHSLHRHARQTLDRRIRSCENENQDIGPKGWSLRRSENKNNPMITLPYLLV